MHFPPDSVEASVGVHVAELEGVDIRNARLDYVLPPIRPLIPYEVAIRAF